MSCNSCHPNGHANPVFHFAGVSGGPGTADVTASVFSTRREDGKRNPVPIPTLVGAGAKQAFGTVVPASDLPSFLHAAISEEFQGASPSRAVVTGVVTYLEGLRAEGCPSERVLDLSFEAGAAELMATLDVAIETVELEDSATARLTLLSLRSVLEQIYRRFPAAVGEREALVTLSRAVAEIQIDSNVPFDREGTIASLHSLRSPFETAIRALRRRQDLSFYEPDVLRSALGQER
jgi:hypothetical protein